MDSAERRGECRLLRTIYDRLGRNGYSEVLVADLARQQQQHQDAKAEGGLPTALRPVARCNHPRLAPAPAKRERILSPAQGDVMAQMRRIFYCRSKLAILLIGRLTATILPQAVHRTAAVAARSARVPQGLRPVVSVKAGIH